MKERSVPIIACSTGVPRGGALAVIRISGFDSLEKLSTCFSGRLNDIETKRATLLNIVKDGVILDSGVVTFFKAPHSYTGENLLEISVHGNPLNVKRIVTYLSERADLSPALPGEFTFRAYKRGKLTLTQIEGLEILLRADSPLVLDQGVQLLQGELHEKYVRLHKTFLDLKGAVELSIDFLEDVGEETADKMLKKSLDSLKRQVDFLCRRSEGDYSSLLSPSVVLLGKTNAGKSSLFNALLDESRSIVSEEEGTTRDFVSEYVSYGDVHYRLVDTAGIRETGNDVEKEGIRRSWELSEKAFFKILVVNPLDGGHEEGDFDLIVFTHGDKCAPPPLDSSGLAVSVSLAAGPIGARAGSIGATGPIGAKAGSIGATGPIGAVIPLDGVRQVIWGYVSDKYQRLSPDYPPLLDRHSRIMGVLKEKLSHLGQLTDEKSQDIGIVASEISSLERCLYSLVGTVDSDEVLDNIFNNFCIGK